MLYSSWPASGSDVWQHFRDSAGRGHERNHQGKRSSDGDRSSPPEDSQVCPDGIGKASGTRKENHGQRAGFSAARTSQSAPFTFSTAPFFSAHSRNPAGAFLTPAMLADLMAAICCHATDCKSALRRVGGGEVGAVEFRAGEIGADEVGVARLALESTVLARSLPRKFAEVEIGVMRSSRAQGAAAQIGGAEVGAEKICVFEMDTLQKCGGSINAHEGNFVGVQFLKRLDAAAAAAFALRSVDDLPGLVVALLDAITGFAEAEDDADEDGEAAEVFEDFKETPAAEAVGGPLQYPLDTPQGKKPGMLEIAFDGLPCGGTAGHSTCNHAFLRCRRESPSLAHAANQSVQGRGKIRQSATEREAAGSSPFPRSGRSHRRNALRSSVGGAVG